MTTTFVPLGTKLNVPGTRRRVTRATLLDRLVDPEPRRLTLVDASAGWGKSTVLAEWAADPRERRRLAWFTVDSSDNDPVRFWAYAIETLRRINPFVSVESAAALGVPGTDPAELVLPLLINELQQLEERLVLVLEDYHLIESDAVHGSLAYLLERLPPTLELAISTRIDPPLPLARLRARGEMLELRAADLRFDELEAKELIAGVTGTVPTEADISLLVRRTEGWPAGLYLAALSLAGRVDPSAFIAAFAGDDRHIVDYLGGEVLEGLDADTRDFLLRSSILARVSADLCNHVLERTDSHSLLLAVERANLFLVPLDERREWYRYHNLFADLLRHELMRSHANEAPELHRRAAEWLLANGGVDEAVRHTLAAGDDEEAAGLVAGNWRTPFNRGELATVDRWLDELPDAVVAANPDLSLARAWVAMDMGRPHEAERWLAGAESGDSAEAVVLHAVLCFKLGKVAHAEEIAAEAVERAPVDSPLGLPVAHCVLGIARYFGGALQESLASLEEAVRLAVAGDNRLARIYALGYLALIRLEQGAVGAAQAADAEALQLAAEPAAAEHFVTALAMLARGRLDMDENALEQAVSLSRRGAAPLEIAVTLLGLGEARRDPVLLAEARSAIAACEDPGRLPRLIEEAELALRGRRRGPRRQIAGDLSDRELAVLRMLPSDASVREIAEALYLSPNTIKTHSRAIYRKLDASSRAEAVERGRELGLI